MSSNTRNQILTFTRPPNPLPHAQMARIPVPVRLAPEGLNRHLERNVGFLTPPLWIASRNELSSIPGGGIAQGRFIFRDQCALENGKSYSDVRCLLGRDQGFFRERRAP